MAPSTPLLNWTTPTMDETKQARRPEFEQELRSLPRYQDMSLRMAPEDRPPKCDICNRSQVRPSCTSPLTRPCLSYPVAPSSSS